MLVSARNGKYLSMQLNLMVFKVMKKPEYFHCLLISFATNSHKLPKLVDKFAHDDHFLINFIYYIERHEFLNDQLEKSNLRNFMANNAINELIWKQNGLRMKKIMGNLSSDSDIFCILKEIETSGILQSFREMERRLMVILHRGTNL